MTSSRVALIVSCLLLALAPITARADLPGELPPEAGIDHENLDPKLGLLAGVVGLASPGAYGSALGAGLRLRLGGYFAASVDLGYGLAGTSPGLQDRWWLFPAIAGIIPVGRLRFDLGAGFGVATSSGYASWAGYEAAPFGPIWHFTVPAVRAHLAAALPVAHRLDLFARLEVVSLLLIGPPNPDAELMDTLWIGLWIGIQYRLL
jgi:hypothetical protein